MRARTESGGHGAGRAVEWRCLACRARLQVKVAFKGRLVWTIDPNDPDFGADFPDPVGTYGKARLLCSADPLHQTGFRLVDGSVERDFSSNA